VSGNVSLYNETKNEDGSGSAILPTPAIGAVGLLDDWESSATIGFKTTGDEIWLVGARGNHLGQTLWLREMAGRHEGPPPAIDLIAERRSGEFVRTLLADNSVTAVHYISEGGLLVAVAEMGLEGNIGADLSIYVGQPSTIWGDAFNDPDLNDSGGERPLDALTTAEAFGEDQARFVVTCRPGAFSGIMESPVALMPVGMVGGDTVQGVTLADLRAAHEGFFPALMSAALP
jgi:phosphoribosylformylglycinamidine synthase